MTNQSLTKLSEKHSKYVNELKESLILGQLSFLKAGEVLYKIKAEKTYEAEDVAHKWTWENFLARPDLPLPGNTPESQIRMAQRLTMLYQLFVFKHQKAEKDLAKIGWPKLELIAKPIKENDSAVVLKAKTQKEADEIIDEWFEKAKNLTWRDLYADIKSGNAPIGTGLQCDHEFEILEWHCPDCGARSKKPMNEKHDDTIIKYKKNKNLIVE